MPGFSDCSADPSAGSGPVVSVVVPVYNAAATLRELHERLTRTLGEIQQRAEIIFVEDCGTDHSWDVLEDICRKDASVRAIRLSRNFGQHAATLCGILRARGKWIVTLDDDLEHEPERIKDLFAKACEGYDLVYGVYHSRSHPLWRNVMSDLARWLFRVAIPGLNGEYSSFRVIRREVARQLAFFDSPFPFVDGYLSWLTNRCASVSVHHGARRSGASNYGVRRLVTHTINIFVTFSDLPLRLATWLGLAGMLFGSVWLGAILYHKVVGDITVSGFASVMAAVISFSGLQLLILGIMGQYLGRISFKVASKPLYVVAGELNAPPTASP